MGMVLQDILERKETLLKPNDINNEDKARAIIGEDCKKENCLQCGGIYSAKKGGCATYQKIMQMAQWKDEQYKTAYVVTRCDLHYDEVEKAFFDKSKAEEYCKPFNENDNNYRRYITEIEVSL